MGVTGRPDTSTTIEPHDEERAQTYLRLFLEADEGIYRSASGGGFVEVNPAMARILGFDSTDELLALQPGASRAFYADEDQAEAFFARLHADGVVARQRMRVRRKDGSLIWISESARVLYAADGSIRGYEGSVIDISARLAAEEALRDSEALYKTLVDNCRDGVFLIQGGIIIYANEALAQMLGYPQSELCGLEYMRLVAPESLAAQVQRRASRELGSREVQAYEIWVRKKDGTRALLEVRADAVDYRGTIASTGTMRDVTEERRHQVALEEAERKYRELFEHAVVGLFQTHPDGRVLEANPALARLLDYSDPRELKASVKHMIDVYADPAERSRLLNQLSTRGGFEGERCRILKRDGTPIWVEINARAILRADGQIDHFEGSVRDISTEVDALEQLSQSQARYRNLVEQSQVGVFVLAGDGETISYVNPAFAGILREPADALCGRALVALIAPEYRAPVQALIADTDRADSPGTDVEAALLGRDRQELAYVVVSAGRVEIDGECRISGTVRDISARRRAELELQHHATHDSLTGLPNRVMFERELRARIEQAQLSNDWRVGLAFLDLDGFKLVNDSLGHAAGDRLLEAIARRLTDALGDRVLVARHGGDEFTLMPTHAADDAALMQLASQVLDLLAEPFDLDGHVVFSGASIGVVMARPGSTDTGTLLRDADTAMYRAKASGKSTAVMFDEAMHVNARVRLETETELRLAIAREEFEVHYQPILELQTGRIRSVEALVRWRHPRRGLLVPGDFLAVAEDSGLVVAIDWWVMQHAMRQLRAWKDSDPALAELGLNLNLDHRQFEDRLLAERIAGHIRDSGLQAEDICIEVTESIYRGNARDAARTLELIKSVGVGLVVDDFGTGYSSLEAFAESPFDGVKLDRAFVRDMVENPRHRAIVRTVARFAEDLGLDLTAEGVETRAQALALGALGCRFAQGYLYARPASAAEIGPRLTEEGLLHARRGAAG